jgi:hypothetical protein
MPTILAASHRAVGRRREAQFDELPVAPWLDWPQPRRMDPIILELRLPPKPAHLVLPARRDRGELIPVRLFRSSTLGVGPPCRASPIARYDDHGVAPTGLRLRGKGPGA